MANFLGSDAVHDFTNGVAGFVDYYGLALHDFLGGNSAANEIYGMGGNDVLIGGLAIVPPTGTGTPADPYYLTDAQVATPSGDDYLEGGSGSDLVHGGDGNDEIYGGRGDDSGTFLGYLPPGTFTWFGGLYGNTGDDYINGGTGDDAIYGGEGEDYLVGSDGEDELTGGEDEDEMIGGSDADTFIFGEDLDDLDGDRIRDFDRKEDDIIDVSAIDARPGGSDNDFDYIGASKFTAKGQISFKNNKLKFNIDNDKQAEAVMIVNTNKLKDADFEL
jgi:Ca2+-binding RTX toxin-like protein